MCVIMLKYFSLDIITAVAPIINIIAQFVVYIYITSEICSHVHYKVKRLDTSLDLLKKVKNPFQQLFLAVLNRPQQY